MVFSAFFSLFLFPFPPGMVCSRLRCFETPEPGLAQKLFSLTLCLLLVSFVLRSALHGIDTILDRPILWRLEIRNMLYFVHKFRGRQFDQIAYE